MAVHLCFGIEDRIRLIGERQLSSWRGTLSRLQSVGSVLWMGMAKFLCALLPWLAMSPLSYAIPNQILGAVNQVNSPLNGEDITDALLAANLWSGEEALPGTWKEEASVASADISFLLARPKVFGSEVVLLRATHREGKLESVIATFADAGSYFRYEPPTTKEQLAARRKALAEKQEKFARMYQERLEELRKQLAAAGFKKPKRAKQGSSRTLRAELDVYQKDDLHLSLLADGRRLIRLMISKHVPHQKSWLDESRRAMSANERATYYRDQVVKKKGGDTLITKVPVVPQGYKPYCGLNTLAMVAYYYGLHVDEDWLAVAGKFQNTGSSGGSNMFRLYNATASEARLKLSRETKFDYRKARSLLRDGLPVVVWRKFDYKRNALHNRVARSYLRDSSVTLPEPDAKERATWPGKKHPVHASVIVGFNDERKEVLFLESWAGFTEPRRMRYEEMEATATWVFYFRNE